METRGNTVLITGGASGIGLALADRFLQSGNTVIVCGRREEKLREAKAAYPALHTRVCDVSAEADRIALARWVEERFPELNILVNNAGIQQRVDLTAAPDNWELYHREISSNFEAPVHLAQLFLGQLMPKKESAFINVTSGLGIAPGVWVPIYSATKAALHSFTVSLRIQLADTNVKVVEVLPPAVNTDLGGVGLHTFGAPLNEFADAVFRELLSGKEEVGYGGTEERLRLTALESKEAARKMYEGMKKR